MSSNSAYSLTFKVAVCKYAREHSIRKTSMMFDIDRKCIREWLKREADLTSFAAVDGKSKRKRLDGGGRKQKFPELEEQLGQWIVSRRQENLPVSPRDVFAQAAQIFSDEGKVFNGSRGWLQRFMNRLQAKEASEATTSATTLPQPSIDSTETATLASAPNPDLPLYTSCNRRKRKL